MPRNRSAEEDLVLLVGLALVALAVWRAIASGLLAAGLRRWWHVHFPHVHGPPRSVVILGVALTLLGLGVYTALRVVATRRTLASRVFYDVVPTDSFEPRPDDVAAFARALRGLRRIILGWLDPNASALRIVYAQTGHGVLGVLWEVPTRALSALLACSSALGPEVEVRQPEPGDAMISKLRGPCPDGLIEKRMELRLARPPYYPLKSVPLQPHPTQVFATAFAMLLESHREDLIVDWGFLPVPAWRAGRVRRRLIRSAEQDETHGFLRDLRQQATASRASSRFTPAVAVERSAESAGLQEKVGRGEPLFGLQILVSARSTDSHRASAILNACRAGLSQWDEQNYLKVVGTPLLGSWFLGSDVGWRRRWFDLRRRTGLFWPPGGNIVGVREMAGVFTPPSKHTQAA